MPIQSPQAQTLYELPYLNTTRPSECNRVSESIDNLVRTLLREGGFPKAACGLTHFATTPLHIAAKHGDVQTTKLLLESGYPLFELDEPYQGEDDNGFTPVNYARQRASLTLNRVAFLKPRTEKQGHMDYAVVEQLIMNARNPLLLYPDRGLPIAERSSMWCKQLGEDFDFRTGRLMLISASSVPYTEALPLPDDQLPRGGKFIDQEVAAENRRLRLRTEFDR
jgi:hypothetical protein